MNTTATIALSAALLIAGATTASADVEFTDDGWIVVHARDALQGTFMLSQDGDWLTIGVGYE